MANGGRFKTNERRQQSSIGILPVGRVARGPEYRLEAYATIQAGSLCNVERRQRYRCAVQEVAQAQFLTSQNTHLIPPKKPRRGPNCGAKTPMPVPLRSW
jgi:hypothetical protein